MMRRSTGDGLLPSHGGRSSRKADASLDTFYKQGLVVAGALCFFVLLIFKPFGGFGQASDDSHINEFKARLQDQRKGGGLSARDRVESNSAQDGASAQEGGLKAIRLMTFNVANYDDHHQWDLRRKMIAQLIVRENADVVALQELRHNPNHALEKGSEPKGQLMQLIKELNREFNRPATLGNACRYHLSKSHYYDKRADFWEGKAILICNSEIEVANVRDIKLKKPTASGDRNMRTIQMAELWIPAPGMRLQQLPVPCPIRY
jgi:hypothetical protein